MRRLETPAANFVACHRPTAASKPRPNFQVDLKISALKTNQVPIARRSVSTRATYDDGGSRVSLEPAISQEPTEERSGWAWLRLTLWRSTAAAALSLGTTP